MNVGKWFCRHTYKYVTFGGWYVTLLDKTPTSVRKFDVRCQQCERILDVSMEKFQWYH